MTRIAVAIFAILWIAYTCLEVGPTMTGHSPLFLIATWGVTLPAMLGCMLFVLERRERAERRRERGAED